MILPLVRITLYILSGLLVGWGLPPETVKEFIEHPEVVGALTGAATLAWYAVAKWAGWKT